MESNPTTPSSSLSSASKKRYIAILIIIIAGVILRIDPLLIGAGLTFYVVYLCCFFGSESFFEERDSRIMISIGVALGAAVFVILAGDYLRWAFYFLVNVVIFGLVLYGAALFVRFFIRMSDKNNQNIPYSGSVSSSISSNALNSYSESNSYSGSSSAADANSNTDTYSDSGAEMIGITCIICYKKHCPTCSNPIMLCYARCRHCGRPYHKHCLEDTVRNMGKCGFCLKDL